MTLTAACILLPPAALAALALWVRQQRRARAAADAARLAVEIAAAEAWIARTQALVDRCPPCPARAMARALIAEEEVKLSAMRADAR